MREAGDTLSRETAAKLSARSPTARRAIAEAAAEVLGFTPAGFKRFVPVVALEGRRHLGVGGLLGLGCARADRGAGRCGCSLI